MDPEGRVVEAGVEVGLCNCSASASVHHCFNWSDKACIMCAFARQARATFQFLFNEGRAGDPRVLDDAGLLGRQGQDRGGHWARPLVPHWVACFLFFTILVSLPDSSNAISFIGFSRDTAVIDKHGYGQIVGRMKDMIIRGGENIYPR